MYLGSVFRVLGPDDRDALDAFLLEHADSSLFLRSNLRAGGIVDHGRPLQGTYAGAFDGGLRAVAAHCWNGNVLVQAPREVEGVVRAAVGGTKRPVTGFAGPWAQVCAARHALGMATRPAAFESPDRLYALAIADVVRPAALDRPNTRCRRTRDADLDLAVEWRVRYSIEILHATEGPALRAEARADMQRHHAGGSAWVLERDGRVVAFSAFNAQLPDVVQIGGVYTPPELRGRGLGRAAVAGSLLAVAGSGVRRAILFTGAENVAAQRAYEAIGFRVIGEYGVVRF